MTEVEGVGLDTFAGKALMACRAKILNIISSSSSPLIANYEMTRYIALHDKFASKGYFITSDNREEMLVKILEDAPELFGDLELFLVLQKRIERIQESFDKYINIVEQLRICDPDDKEHILGIVSSFLEL